MVSKNARLNKEREKERNKERKRKGENLKDKGLRPKL
jgi:hypothetical protein